MKTVILGLGNPILYDDGAGCEAAEQLRRWVVAPEVEIRTASVGGLRILDEITGFDKAIIIDALMTGRTEPGTVTKMSVEELSGDLHASCLHDLSFSEALKLGKMMGMMIPEQITIYGIEVADPYTLQEGCSSAVLDGVGEAVKRIKEDLVEEH
jgi:hydrogenase maturation protease